MSFMPFVASWLFLWGILSIFLWNVWSLTLFTIVVCVLLMCCFTEVVVSGRRYLSSFVIFVFSEALIFVTLVLSVCWFNCAEMSKLGPWFGWPMLGTALLLSSSVTAATFHHSMGVAEGFTWLKVTIALGVLFVFLQYVECRDCRVNLVDSAYYSASICLVGLHFLHVIIGLAALFYVLKFFEQTVTSYHPGLVVWYWHFVDYVWILVYFAVYIA
uniref:Cytochrome c oxidase subunit 3 n=1 Tax=Lyperosomum longicauda TaxID=2714089 RepID=A0A6H0YBU1_9TREM|nr:cytochrome c oxidase subunit 3 [Lyperosomum longicauda]QIX04649.1 cytochrome c oxidase subunit 3 [Lyperosomum longicauda]